MRLIIFGGPGSGKGTQAKELCSRLRITAVATGDMLRQAIAEQTHLGRQIQPYVEKGELAPDEIMIQFIQQRLNQPDVAPGWLLDGYPRTAFQAEELDFLLDELNQRLDRAIYLEVPDATLLSRSLHRSRMDDQPDVIQRRIQLFHDRTLPMLEYYERRGRLLRIDGDRPLEDVHHAILNGLGIAL
ncbi:MAG: adenylate kinase [Leptolyngbyaceae cyanobacterium bins.59]|nr:adenylate kinase [Leptolyngbyaceae cyanobacterium bins.59]